MAYALGAVVVAVIGGTAWRQERINDDLRAELSQLRGRAVVGGATREAQPSGVADPAAWDRRAAAERVELARMRSEIAALKTRTQEIAHLAVRAADGTVPLNLVPSQGWKNAGRETPTAAIETLLWAADGGDVEALAATLTLDPAAREKAAAILGRLPESARAGYGTPERLVALLMAQDPGDVTAMQVLAEHRAGDNALVNVRTQKGDGKTKDEGYQFRRANDGWQMVVTGKAVDKFGKKLTEPKKK